MAEMSRDFAVRFREFARFLPAHLVEKGLKVTWWADSDRVPFKLSVEGSPEAWQEFLQTAIAILSQQEQEKQGERTGAQTIEMAKALGEPTTRADMVRAALDEVEHATERVKAMVAQVKSLL